MTSTAKCLEFGIVIELRPTAAGRFDHNVNVTIFGERRQIDKIWHGQSLKVHTARTRSRRLSRKNAISWRRIFSFGPRGKLSLFRL